MLNLICPAIVALIFATSVSWLELVTSKYPRTLFLIKNYRSLYVYAFVYGLAGFAIMIVLSLFTKVDDIQITGPLLTTRWGQAVAVGLSTKALLHIRLFTVSTGSQSVPVGIESIVHLFEPTLLQNIDLHEFYKVREFLKPPSAKYPDLAVVKQMILSDLPQSFSGAERTSFETDINKAATVVSAMEVYLRRFGKANFNRVFTP